MLTTLGVFLSNNNNVYLGRVVFGLAEATLPVVCLKYASAWFKGKALSMTVGFLFIGFSGGFALSILILEEIYEMFLPDEEENKALGLTLLIATIAVVFFSLFAAIILGSMSKKRLIFLGHHLEEQPKVQYWILKVIFLPLQ